MLFKIFFFFFILLIPVVQNYPKTTDPIRCDPYYYMPLEEKNKKYLYKHPRFTHGEIGVVPKPSDPGVWEQFNGKTYDGDIVYHNLTNGNNAGGGCGLGINWVCFLFLLI
jgi:hypothetical protein